MTRLDGLEEELLRIDSVYSASWTYALTDISSGKRIGYRQDDVMPTASLIKVPVLVALRPLTLALRPGRGCLSAAGF